MVDALFHALARRRKAEAFRAEREAKKQSQRLAKVRAELTGESKTIHLNGPIGDRPGEFGARWLRSELPTDGREVRLVIHSEGGSVFESLAMHDILRAYNGRVVGIVASAAFSAASLLLTACDEVQGTSNSFVMVHNSGMEEDAELSDSEQRLLTDLDETMVRLYSERTGQSPQTIRLMMQSETFLDATEAKRLGFIDTISEPKNLRIVAKRISPKNAVKVSATARWRAAVMDCGSVRAADKKHPGLRLKMLAEVNAR
ncbi:MAG: Clp protease ClpP [Planctomycetaceae bacterium]|nr:Clp protease ClpP [Planctomycetaceae bacterium]